MKFDKPIALAADHGGYELTDALQAHPAEQGGDSTHFSNHSHPHIE